MSKHIIIDEIWVSNRFRTRKRMTGKKLFLDKESGFLTTATKHGFHLELKQAFLERFKHCSNIYQIAKSLNINIQTIYDHIAMDPKFREEFTKLDAIIDKETQLNDSLLALKEEHKAAFIADLLSKTDKYH